MLAASAKPPCFAAAAPRLLSDPGTDAAETAHSQSKLTQEQLTELQQATLFERKELQQWYKGASARQAPQLLRLVYCGDV